MTPYGIWNVDHGSPIIIPIQQPYEVGFTKIFPSSQLGLMSYGTVFLGDYDVNYKLYVASSKADGGSGEEALVKDLKDLAGGGNLSVNLPYLDELKIGVSGYSAAEVVADNQAVFTLPVDMSGNIVGAPTFSYNNEIYSKHHKIMCFGADVRLSLYNFVLQGEYNTQFRKDLLGDDEAQYTGYYGLLAYKHRLNENFYIMPFGMYEEIITDHGKGTIIGSVEPELDGYVVISGGINIGVYSNCNIKLEYDASEVNASKARGLKDGVIDVSIFKTQFTVSF